MAIRRIVKIEEPHKRDRTYRGGLFNVWFEGAVESVGGFAEETNPVAMFKDQFDLVVFEDELLQRGISSADIENHKNLVSAWCADEAADSENMRYPSY